MSIGGTTARMVSYERATPARASKDIYYIYHPCYDGRCTIIARNSPCNCGACFGRH